MSLPVIPAAPMADAKPLRQSRGPKSADRDFPRSLQSAVKEPGSARPDPADARPPSEQSTEPPRSEVAPGQRREVVADEAPVPTPEADTAIADPVIDSERPDSATQDSAKSAELIAQATSAIDLLVEATGMQELEIDLTDTQLESGDLALSLSTVAEFVEDEILPQESVLDLEGLAQFLDAVPSKSSEAVQSLAEIVAQFLTDGPEIETDDAVVEGSESVPVTNLQTSDTASELLITTADSATLDIATSDIATSDIATLDIATSDTASVDIATLDIATLDTATVDIVTADITATTVPAEVSPALSDGPVVTGQEAVSVAGPELGETSVVASDFLLSESSAVVAGVAATMQTSTEQPASEAQSPGNQPSHFIRAQGTLETPSSLGQDDPQSGSEGHSQEATAPQAVTSQAPEASRPGADTTQQVRLDQSATPQVATVAQRGEGTAAESIGRAAVRLVERIEVLRNAPPPRSMVLELTELEGARVRVSLDGNVVRMTVLDGSLDPDAREQLDRELNQALAREGFDLANSSEEQRERWEEAQERGKALTSGEQRIRRPRATGLRL